MAASLTAFPTTTAFAPRVTAPRAKRVSTVTKAGKYDDELLETAVRARFRKDLNNDKSAFSPRSLAEKPKSVGPPGVRPSASRLDRARLTSLPARFLRLFSPADQDDPARQGHPRGR